MNVDRFQASPSGRLVRARTGAIQYWAFVPHPLPPAVEFDAELARTLADAAQGIGELGALGRMLPNPHLLINPFIRREAVLSSRIEGTQANVADLYALEAGQLPIPGFAPTPPEADVREVANYVHALDYALDRVQTLPVGLRLVREMHNRLMEGVRDEQARPGQFRDDQNWIGAPGCSVTEASFVPPRVGEMLDALDAWEKYLHQEDPLHPLVRLALIHYQFEAIHPFVDGNGRIGRLLVSLLLVHWGLLPAPLLYLSAYFEHHRDPYLDLLLAVSERGAWREWLLFFLRGVAEQARDAVRRGQRLQDLQREWRARISEGRASARALHLVDHLFESPILTISQAAEVLGITYPAAQANVQKLLGAGILKQVGPATVYGKFYAALDIIMTIEDLDTEL